MGHIGIMKEFAIKRKQGAESEFPAPWIGSYAYLVLPKQSFLSKKMSYMKHKTKKRGKRKQIEKLSCCF
jgi:hypothetical protein